LEKVVKTRELHRAARAKVPFPIVALVGYTNAGKSTLFNHLTGAEVMVEDMLFATLDPTMRRVALPHGGPEVILSDTVGFISDLPTELVAAFRATLEEVLEADLICHVRDISHPETEAQARDVTAILENLGVKDTTPQIEVWNKIDRLDEAGRRAALTQAARLETVQAVSAVTGQGVDALVSAISQALSALRHVSTLHVGFDEGRKRAWLYEKDLVEDERQTEDGFVMTVHWSSRHEDQFREM